MAKKVVEGRIRLNNVRLSFPELFRPKSFKGEDGKESEKRYKGNFLIPKNDGIWDEENPDDRATATYKGETGPVLAMLKKAKFDALAFKVGPDKARQMMPKIKPDKYAVRDGDMETWDGYEDCYYASAANTKKPKIVGRHNKQEVTEQDGILYAECYVNAVITLWFQAAGKKGENIVPNAIWAMLNAVQFLADGESFGAGEVDPEEEFENITDETDSVSTEDDFGDDSPI